MGSRHWRCGVSQPTDWGPGAAAVIDAELALRPVPEKPPTTGQVIWAVSDVCKALHRAGLHYDADTAGLRLRITVE